MVDPVARATSRFVESAIAWILSRMLPNSAARRAEPAGRLH